MSPSGAFTGRQRRNMFIACRGLGRHMRSRHHPFLFFSPPKPTHSGFQVGGTCAPCQSALSAPRANRTLLLSPFSHTGTSQSDETNKCHPEVSGTAKIAARGVPRNLRIFLLCWTLPKLPRDSPGTFCGPSRNSHHCFFRHGFSER